MPNSRVTNKTLKLELELMNLDHFELLFIHCYLPFSIAIIYNLHTVSYLINKCNTPCIFFVVTLPVPAYFIIQKILHSQLRWSIISLLLRVDNAL